MYHEFFVSILKIENQKLKILSAIYRYVYRMSIFICFEGQFCVILAKCIFTRIKHVQESIIGLVELVKFANCACYNWNNVLLYDDKN